MRNEEACAGVRKRRRESGVLVGVERVVFFSSCVRLHRVCARVCVRVRVFVCAFRGRVLLHAVRFHHFLPAWPRCVFRPNSIHYASSSPHLHARPLARPLLCLCVREQRQQRSLRLSRVAASTPCASAPFGLPVAHDVDGRAAFRPTMLKRSKHARLRRLTIRRLFTPRDERVGLPNRALLGAFWGVSTCKQLPIGHNQTCGIFTPPQTRTLCSLVPRNPR